MTIGLFLSLVSFFNNILVNTGTRVSVNNNAPSKAKLRVQARGENILPSTFSKAKIGIRQVMMMTLEKNIALARRGSCFPDDAQLGHLIVFLHPDIMGLHGEHHKQSFHHHHGAIYDDSKIDCTHGKQVGGHAFYL